MSNLFRCQIAYLPMVLSLLFMGVPMCMAQEVAEAATETAVAESKGQADLDAATALKLNVSSMADLEKVVALCESAMEKGLDPESEQLAKGLITATLFQHGSRFAQALFNPRERNQRPEMLKRFALKDLYKILEYDDELAQVHMMIARLESITRLPPQQRQGDPNWKKGRASADRAIELITDDDELLSKAYVLRAGYAGNNKERMELFDKAIETDGKNTDAWRMRGKQRLLEGELYAAVGQADKAKEIREQAIEDFNKLLEANPDDPDALQAVAELMSRLGNNDEALAKVTRAIEGTRRAPSLYILRGRIHTKREDYEEAIKDFNRAVDLQPDSHVALIDRMEAHYLAGDKDTAARDFGRARELVGAPNLVRELLNRVRLRSQSDPKKAIPDLQRLTDIDELDADESGRQPDFDIRNELAVQYSFNQQPLEAIDSYSIMLERAGKANSSVMRQVRKTALEGRANAYLGIGKHVEAISDYEGVLKIDPNGDGALNNLAWVLATSPNDTLRDGERAIELATKACEVTQYNAPHILSTLAASYAETGNFKEAVKRSSEAVEKLDAQLKDQKDRRDLDPTESQLETQVQLKNELKSYEEQKPWRELQDILKEKADEKADEKSDEKADEKSDEKADE